MEPIHAPVLVQEIIEGLSPASGEVFLDGTLGSGGHAAEIMPLLGESGHYIALDQDEAAIERSKPRLEHHTPQQTYLHENFAHVAELWLANQLPLAGKVLLDLGWSSDQFADHERGFSFQSDGPLDMRLDTSKDHRITAFDLVNTLDADQLASIIKNYGEERYAKRIAREIVYHRNEFGPIERTKALVEVIIAAVPASYTRTKIHPATRTFQALRIAVNDELGVLERGLEGLLAVTKPTARIAVISFHSLEDRIVKHTFRDWKEQEIGTIITKKPIVASAEETKANPRARSAKLRIFNRNQ